MAELRRYRAWWPHSSQFFSALSPIDWPPPGGSAIPTKTRQATGCCADRTDAQFHHQYARNNTRNDAGIHD
jgi:hypothetical protein